MGAVAAGMAVSAVGNYLGAKKASSAAKEAAIRQEQAAQAAREEMRFRPVGITTRFGSATPQFEDGRFSGYSYAATPELQALQDQLSGIYGGSLGQVSEAAALQPQYMQAGQGLFNLGQQYLATTPQEAKQQYMSEQMAALRPYDIEEEQRLAASVFGRGRGGLSVGAGGQPELQALSESRRRRDLQLAAGAEQAAQQRIGFGTGLLGQGTGVIGQGYGLQQAAMTPFQQQFALAQQLEGAAQQPLQIGSELGQAASAAGKYAGAAYQSGMQNAALSQQQAANTMAGFYGQLGSSLGGMFSGMGSSSAGGGTVPGIMGRTAAGVPYQYGARNAPGSWGQPY